MKRSDFTKRRLPSGFWSVWFRQIWINASLMTEAAADAFIDSIIKEGRIF